MTSRNGKVFEGTSDGIQAMVPEVVMAVESLKVATPEEVRACLERLDIKATESETEMILEYGCKLGVMEETRKYSLNPELKNAIDITTKKTSDNCTKNAANLGSNARMTEEVRDSQKSESCDDDEEYEEDEELDTDNCEVETIEDEED